MPWTESSVMNERMIFIAACLADEEPFSQTGVRLGISRTTGYKWLARYEAAGAAGLCDVSSARHTQSHSITPAVADRLIALRRSRPTWGPRKLLARLTMDDSETDWPAPSTVGDLLRRHDLSKPRPRRRHRAGGKPVLILPTAANESWAIDFKGWFRTRDGTRCDSLTVMRRSLPVVH